MRKGNLMKRIIFGICLFLGCLFTVLTSYAGNNLQSTQHTTIELFHNGKDSVLAKFSIQPDWHIYWSNPGEIGFPTTIKAMNSSLDIVNQSVPQIRTVYETMNEYLYENSAYFELKLDNLQHAEIAFDFVECSDVCKPEKLIFDMAELPSANDKLWQEIKNTATATFPQKIKLNSPIGQNEVQIKAAASDIKFIPTEQNIVDDTSIEITGNRKNTHITWQSGPEQRLEQALIITPQNSYLADIIYTESYLSLLYLVIFAFIGGIILNAMPCVFPILSLKIFTLIKQRKRSAKRARLNAFLYICGVLLSFLLLTTCLIVLKNGGEAVGWGFQLQSAWFVGIMTLIFAFLFLYMMEWIHFPNFANRYIHKAAGFNDFTTGFFAVLIASPCTGPFMGAAIGYAFMRSNVEIFAVFISLALGYALPYALIEMYPQAINRILPKPGKWMRKVKIILSMPVLITAIWLADVWYSQITDSYIAIEESNELKWQKYNPQVISELNNKNENIFIDFTADWCLTCKVNEKLILNSKRFQNFIKQNNVHLFVADLTENNEDYQQALFSYGRDSIPLYVYYSSGNYKILPLFFSINDLNKPF